MQERLNNMSPVRIRESFFSDSGCLKNFRAEYKRSFGQLNPKLAVRIADMVALREEQNSPEKVIQTINDCLYMAGVNEKLATDFLGVRNSVLLNIPARGNVDQASLMAMEQFFHRENLYQL